MVQRSYWEPGEGGQIEGRGEEEEAVERGGRMRKGKGGKHRELEGDTRRSREERTREKVTEQWRAEVEEGQDRLDRVSPAEGMLGGRLTV